MKMITMWKEYYKEVIVPSWNWLKVYWREYFLLSLVVSLCVGIYYQILFTRYYRY